MATVISVLSETRRLVEGGWAKHAYRKDGCFCLVGAVLEATDECEELEVPVLEALYRQVPVEAKLQSMSAYDGLLRFNDNPIRSKEEILSLIDRAIVAETPCVADSDS